MEKTYTEAEVKKMLTSILDEVLDLAEGFEEISISKELKGDKDGMKKFHGAEHGARQAVATAQNMIRGEYGFDLRVM